MEGRQKNYFVCANSAKGFYNLFDSNLAGLKKIYIIKGGPGDETSTLMKKIGERYRLKGMDTEYIHCPLYPDSLDGVIFRSIGIGIVDGTSPHVIEPKAPGAIEEYVNLSLAWDTDYLSEHSTAILELQKRISENYCKAYESFQKALKIHDEWETVFIRNMNFQAANRISDELAEEIFHDVEKRKQGMVHHRFFGGSTPKGAMDFVPSLIQDVDKRYFIKGRPGSGKSTMLRKLLKQAEELELEVEVYHCGFDPDSLDMLLFPEISVCIFDSTAPHEYEPEREGDHIVDMYQKTIRLGTDEDYEDKLQDIKVRYKRMVNQGIEFLQKVKNLYDELKSFYLEATDVRIVNDIAEDLIHRMDLFIKKNQ